CGPRRRTRPLWRRARRPSRARSRPGARESFFKILDRALSLLVMTGTSRELTISHGAQFPAQCLLGDDDAEFLEDPLAEVDDPPAHDAMHGRDRAALEYRGERGAVRAVQTRRLSGRLAINQPSRPMGVELHHPIANDLERHPADFRRLGPARAVVNRRQRQKPPGLRPILRPPRGSPHHPRIKISPKWNGHGEPPALATLNQTHADSGIPLRVTLTELRYQVPESVFPAAACAAYLPLGPLDVALIVLVFFVGELATSRLFFAVGVRDRPY